MATAGFIEIQLDPKVAFGTRAGLGYTTIVNANPSRIETRIQQQSRGYWKFAISFKDKSKIQINAIAAHYQQVQGKTYGWRFRNYREYYTSTDDYATGTSPPTPVSEPLTYTTGLTVQLIHTRRPGTTTAEVVPIRKPDMSVAIVLYRNGIVWASAGNWTLDTTTGVITFAVNQSGNTFRWLGYWDTPVRFDTDDMSAEWADYDVHNWDSVNLMEIQVP